MEERRTIAIGDDGRIWISQNFRHDEKIEWTEVFEEEVRKQILEALEHDLGPQDEDLLGKPLS